MTVFTMFGDGIWGILVVVGPILLAMAIAWAALNNRQSKRQARRTEEATRELYQAEDTKNKAEGR